MIGFSGCQSNWSHSKASDWLAMKEKVMEGKSTGTLLPLIYVFHILRDSTYLNISCLFYSTFHELVKHRAMRMLGIYS